MPYTLQLKIPGLPKTLNGSHGHWMTKARERRVWREVVVCAVGTKRPAQPLVRAKLTLTRVSTKAPDSDNLAASFKSVIDGLVDAGVLADDKYINIGMPHYEWEPGKLRQGYVRVRVEELD